MRANYATLLLILLAGAMVIHYGWNLPWTPLRVASLFVLIPSLLLLAVARIQLGKSFSVQAKASAALVTTGLYSRIRNPIYVFGGLTVAAGFVWANMPWLLCSFLVIVPMQIYRIRKEGQVLTERFGNEYLEYKKKTWF
jgi:protein-S-isoprenylcysteine O-methyltransferase Ste14